MKLAVTEETFSYALNLFAILVLTQIFVWRWRAFWGKRVRRQIVTLFAIYLGGPLVALGWSGDAAGTLLVLSHSIVYVLIFPAAAAKSPSFEILLLLFREPGLTTEEIRRRLGQGRLLQDRLRDLSDDGLMGKDRRIGLGGKCVAAFFLTYRRLLGIPRGTG